MQQRLAAEPDRHPGGIKVQLDLVQFDHKPSAFRVIDNGHTVQVNVAPGNSIEVMGRRYELAQFHFHRPSEERIDVRQFDMVVHLVHKDPEGRLAVVAVLLERGSAQPGAENLEQPAAREGRGSAGARHARPRAALLPSERSYFTYMGSLTTPPCSEGCAVDGDEAAVTISPEQIGISRAPVPDERAADPAGPPAGSSRNPTRASRLARASCFPDARHVLLILGLALFLGVHSISIAAVGDDAQAARLGENA